MFSRTYQSFDGGRQQDRKEEQPPFEQPPLFRRLSREAQPVPGTIVVGCSVCGVRYQKRTECDYFHCEGCGALVTHGSHDSASLAPAPMNAITVNVQQASPTSKKKKKKKKKRSSSSSNSSDSSSSSEHRKKRGSRSRIRALEKQCEALKSRPNSEPQSAGYSGGSPGSWPAPWPSSSPGQLMDAWPSSSPSSPCAAAACDSWPTMGSQMSQSSAASPSGGQRNSKNPFTGDGAMWPSNDCQAADDSGWGLWPSSGAAVSGAAWSPKQAEATAMSSANPFGQPQVTVNLPRDITGLSSEQLLLLAQAKRCVEQAEKQQQQKDQPLQLQFTKPGTK